MLMFKRVFITLTIFALAPLILFSAAYYVHSYSVLREDVITAMRYRLKAIDEDIADTVSKGRSDVLSWAHMSIPEICYEYNRPEAMEVFLTNLINTYKIYSDITTYDAQGRLFATNKQAKDEDVKITQLPSNILTKSFFEDGAEVILMRGDNGAKLAIIARVQNRVDELLGYMAAFIRWSDLENITERGQYTSSSTVLAGSEKMFFDDKLVPIDKANSHYSGDFTNVADMSDRQIGNMWTVKDGKYLTACIVSDSLSMGSSIVECVRADKLAMLSSLKSVRYIAMAIAALAMIVAALISYVIAKRLVSPFKEIVNIISRHYMSQEGRVRLQDDCDVESLKDQILGLIDHLVKSERKLAESINLTAIGEMCAMVAHDVRTPVSVMKAYTMSLDKLSHMADDLVCYSNVGNTERSVCNVNNMVRHVLSEISASSKSKDVRIKCEPKQDIDANIDGYSIERAIENIMVNACQSCAADGVVSVCTMVGENNTLVIQIYDNGCGISEDHLAMVFNPFFTKGKKGGTGLGLAYCKQVVEAHGGIIDVESEVGKGTTFTIRIPNCVVDEVPERAEKNEPEIKCQNRRFIIVDDDSDIRMRWRKIVQENGGTVAHEASSLEDIEARDGEIDYRDIDVAMVDYHYEGSKHSGADVIRHMRSRGVSEVHLCTGFYDDESVRDEAFSAGADSVIPKG
jgi:signal transduction histidine kinase/CheY-like chemotaxis protein